MAAVEPVAGEPAAVATADGRRALVVADYHAGIEAGLRRERGVELGSDADARRERLLALLDRTDPDRLILLGDLAHRIGDPEGAEGEELADVVDAATDRVPTTLVPGNHDGGVGEAHPDLSVAPADGLRCGDVAFCHGHTWPAADLLGAGTLCIGHEHPAVRLEDAVGGARLERAWLRGRLRPGPFADRYGVAPDDLEWGEPELVVFPAFNDRSGGTWVNVEGQGFLSPFLPAALDGAEAYLLDGTRLGDYRAV
ncbi:MAG: metallophosphoesterase [Haloferacaceae archaeon]